MTLDHTRTADGPNYGYSIADDAESTDGLRTLSYNPADAIAAVNVSGHVLQTMSRENGMRWVMDIIAVGKDHGRRNASVVLVALSNRYMDRGYEFVSYVVRHDGLLIHSGQYYGNDGLEDAFRLFALRTLTPADGRYPPRAGERHSCGRMVAYGDVVTHTCADW